MYVAWCRGASPRDGHLVPQAAVKVEVISVGLAGDAVADVGVQRVPVVGELTGAIAGGIRAGNPAGAAAMPSAGAFAAASGRTGASASVARTANAATSITPAAMPAVARTS
jgi:hypothetical protein